MTGMVFGSTELPLAPWHAAQGCAFASMSSAACARSTVTAKPMPAATIAEKNRVSMTTSPSLSRQQSVAGCHNRFHQESAMQGRLMLTLTATAIAMAFPPAIGAVRAEGQAALTGIVSSEAEGKMEGVVVTARRAKSIVQVSVTTDADGRYTFPRDRLQAGDYTLSIRAVGYDIDSPAKATVNGKSASADIKLKKTRNLAGQLTNAEWMMSIPGAEEQKAGLLNCVGCHTLERVVRSTHDSDEWTRVISRMMGYGAVSQRVVGIRRGHPADQAASNARSRSRRNARAVSQARRLSRDHQPERGRPLGVRTEDAAAAEGPGHARHRHSVRRRAADERAA